MSRPPTTTAGADGPISTLAGDGTPWEPPGLRFEVGQRVQIRLSAECHVAGGAPYSVNDITGRSGHAELEEGLTGVIGETADPYVPGHPYLVWFDRMVVVEGLHCAASVYAGAELIPLPDAADTPAGEEDDA